MNNELDVTNERLGVTTGRLGRLGVVCLCIVSKCGELDNPHGLSIVSATCAETRSSVPGMSSSKRSSFTAFASLSERRRYGLWSMAESDKQRQWLLFLYLGAIL